MATVVQFMAPGVVALVDEATSPLVAGSVRVQTLHSGISAGTELTAFRGTNPYLTSAWDADRRLFVHGSPSFAYPVSGWGYSEVGKVVEVASDVASPRVGDTVWGIWGHRSEAVVPAAKLAGRVLPTETEPLAGIFGRVGAVALNAVLAADARLGESIAIFGQGVIGLLASRLGTLTGAHVLAVDTVPQRLEMARAMGAVAGVDPTACEPVGAAAALRELAGHHGVDVAIELAGSYAALHDAIRTVGQGGTVVAAGFYQGDAAGLRLGEEFHHNQVQVVASQIGSVPLPLSRRWDVERLHLAFMAQVVSGALDPLPLVTHRFAAHDVATAFALLDSSGADALQVVLDFDGATP